MNFLAYLFDKNNENPASEEKFFDTLSPGDRHALAKLAISFV